MKASVPSLDKLDWLQLLSAAFPIPMALVSIGAFLYSGGGSLFYVTLAVGTAAHLALEKITRLAFEQRFSAEIRSLMPTTGDIKQLGGNSDGIRWLIERMDGLEHVHNTAFCRSDGRFHSASKLSGELNAAIKKAISRGCTWHDIVLDGEKGAIDSFVSELSADERTRYRVTEVKSDLPLVQAIVLEYTNRTKFVLFGWGMPGLQEIDSQVFLATDPAAVGYFLKYLGLLQARGADLALSTMPPNPKAKEPLGIRRLWAARPH